MRREKKCVCVWGVMEQEGQRPGGAVGFMVMRVGTETALNRNKKVYDRKGKGGGRQGRWEKMIHGHEGGQ